MVIFNLYIRETIAIFQLETDSILFVDPNTVLILSWARKLFQMIRRRNTQIV
ncbi:MAG: hypothetical protein ACFWTM_03625 [Mitsuokella multacida]